MKMRGVLAAGVMMVVAALLSSCASTSLLTSWADPEAAGKGIDKCLVIGVSNNTVARRQFEDTFVAQLQKMGETAMPSYPLLPNAAEINEQTVAPIIDRNQIGHVLVVRVVDKKTVTTYVPPSTTTSYYGGYPSYYPSYYGSWSGYYGHHYSTVTTPGYTYDTQYVNLETNVYDIRSGKLIWSGLTETEIGSQINAQMQELVQVLTAAMHKDKIL
jgi:hypothetical protein